jgi:hypothetical protein
MIKIKVNNQGVDEYISLSEYLIRYHQKAPKGWFDYINGWVDEGLNIKNDEEYKTFSEHSFILEHFNYKSAQRLYFSLKLSKYESMFDDDLLRFISYIYALGYFERANYVIDINNPDLDKFINTKNVFQSYYQRSLLSEEEKYSLMDLLPLKYGMNAIRRELLLFSKW